MKKFWTSVVAIFIASSALTFLVHGVLLKNDYAQLPNLMRSEAETQQFFPWIIVAHLLFSIGLVWIYRQGRQNRPYLGQGIRFGIAAAIFSPIPLYLIYYAVQPLPAILVIKQISFDSIVCLILGVMIAWLNREEAL